jgi:hypothetical protein
VKLHYRTVLAVNRQASLRNTGDIWQRLRRWRNTKACAGLLGLPIAPVYFGIWRERRAEIGAGEALPFDPTPRGDKSLGDCQQQLEAKRKRKK